MCKFNKRSLECSLNWCFPFSYSWCDFIHYFLPFQGWESAPVFEWVFPFLYRWCDCIYHLVRLQGWLLRLSACGGCLKCDFRGGIQTAAAWGKYTIRCQSYPKAVCTICNCTDCKPAELFQLNCKSCHKTQNVISISYVSIPKLNHSL